MKPLFIPLKTEYYNAFSNGSKWAELRLYGPRWNENTCAVGRDVVLSKGYGKRSRMNGRVAEFTKAKGHQFSSCHREAIQAIYGTLDVEIACIGITDIQAI